jgi:hypothetical protein
MDKIFQSTLNSILSSLPSKHSIVYRLRLSNPEVMLFHLITMNDKMKNLTGLKGANLIYGDCIL